MSKTSNKLIAGVRKVKENLSTEPVQPKQPVRSEKEADKKIVNTNPGSQLNPTNVWPD